MGLAVRGATLLIFFLDKGNKKTKRLPVDLFVSFMSFGRETGSFFFGFPPQEQKSVCYVVRTFRQGVERIHVRCNIFLFKRGWYFCHLAKIDLSLFYFIWLFSPHPSWFIVYKFAGACITSVITMSTRRSGRSAITERSGGPARKRRRVGKRKPKDPNSTQLTAAVKKRFYKRHGATRVEPAALDPMDRVMEGFTNRVLNLCMRMAIKEGLHTVLPRHVNRALKIMGTSVY